MALGASAQTAQDVVRQGMALALAGNHRVRRHWGDAVNGKPIYGVTPKDPIAMTSVALLLVESLSPPLPPGRRASQMDR